MSMLRISILLISLSVIATTSLAQEARVESHIFGAQAGTSGIWLHHEARLAGQWVLRSEIGLDMGFLIGSAYYRGGFDATPVLRFEPRWYYNLKRRASKGLDSAHNSANYFSVRTSISPNFSTSSNPIVTREVFSIIPTWGARRNLGKKFHMEAGMGVGYSFETQPLQAGPFFFHSPELIGRDAIVPYVHLRIGYRF